MRYYIVDAFADRPFGGNPAGVVLLEGEGFPDEELMLKVSVELRFSETAFVRRHSPQEYTVRYFTPQAEVDLCGHATIATFYLLHRLGMADGRCLCHTLAGDVAVEAGDRVMMQMAPGRIVGTVDDPTDIYRALGMDGYHPSLPVQLAYTGLTDLMIQVPDVHTLHALQPDMDAVVAQTRQHGAVSFHVFAFGDDGHTAHVRDFAPLYGIPEESATGTANAALTWYLRCLGCLPSEAECTFLQGEAMGRPSVIATRLMPDGTLYVGGVAAVVGRGELLLD